MIALQNRVYETECVFVENPSAVAKVDWEEAQQLLKDHMMLIADNKRFFIQQKYFLEGESAGHLLVTIVKSQQGPSHVAKLVRVDGVEVTEGMTPFTPTINNCILLEVRDRRKT